MEMDSKKKRVQKDACRRRKDGWLPWTWVNKEVLGGGKTIAGIG